MKIKIFAITFLFIISFSSIFVIADENYVVSSNGTSTTYNLDLVELPIEIIPTEKVIETEIPQPIEEVKGSEISIEEPIIEEPVIEDTSTTETPLDGYSLMLPPNPSNYFSIINVNYLNSNNESCSNLSNNGIVKSITIRKNIIEIVPSSIIVCLYDNYRFIEFKMAYISDDISSGLDYTYNLDIALPDDISHYKLKAFVWDGFSSITPYSDVYNTADIVAPNALLTKNLNDYTMTEILLLLIFLILFLNFVKSLFYMRGAL